MEVQISFHFRGTFFGRYKRVLYRKGEVYVTPATDPDLLSYFELEDMFKNGTGIKGVRELWYLESGKAINDGLKQIKTDGDINLMVQNISPAKIAYVYVVLDGESSPSTVFCHVGGESSLRRSPRKKIASKTDCRAVVVYEGGSHGEDTPGNQLDSHDLPTQASNNLPSKSDDAMNKVSNIPDGADMVDEEGSGTEGIDDSDCSVEDCDFADSDEEDCDIFNECVDEGLGERNDLYDDIAREFDFENETRGEQYPDSEVEEESDGLKTPDASDDEQTKGRRFHVFSEEDGFNPPVHLEEGMLFASKELFKRAIAQYSVEKGGDFYYLHNDKKKVNVLCKKKCNCPWKHCRRSCGAKGCGTVLCRFRAAARLYTDDGTFQLKTLCGEHTCGRQFLNNRVTSKFLADKYLEHYKDDPGMKLRVFINTVRRDLHVNITLSQAHRTRMRAYRMLQGDAKEQYGMVCDYAETMLKHKVALAAYVLCHGTIEKPIFQRFFVCLDACRDGFLRGCRPIFGLDGCHLKGAYTGQILSAVAKDANENIFPIAYAVVESECKDSWCWFLEILLPLLGDIQLCIMSDRQKGLLEAIKEKAPTAEQRFCVRHLYGNFREKFGNGVVMREQIWRAARATRRVDFDGVMEEIRGKSERAADWLIAKGVSGWSKHSFKFFPKSDMLLNNGCESWNKFILEARDKPILSCCEWIRRSLMRRMARKKEGILKWQGNISPKAAKRLEIAKNIGQEKCMVTIGGHHRYEVEHRDEVYIVDMLRCSCTCNKWALTGIPCPHAAVVILSTRGLVLENYVDNYYKKERWLLAYEENIRTMPGRKEWEKSDRPHPETPVFKAQPGRPKKKRRREEGEQSTQKRIRFCGAQRYKCGNCGLLGHTRKTCNHPQRSATKQRPRKQRGGSASEPLRKDNPRRSGRKKGPVTFADEVGASTEVPHDVPRHVGNSSEPAVDELVESGRESIHMQLDSQNSKSQANTQEEHAGMPPIGRVDHKGKGVVICEGDEHTSRNEIEDNMAPKQKKKDKKGKGLYIWEEEDDFVSEWDDEERYRWEDAPVTGSIPTSPIQWKWGRSPTQTLSEIPQHEQAKQNAPKEKVIKKVVSKEVRRSSRGLSTVQLRKKPLWRP